MKFASGTDYTEREQVKARSILNTNQMQATSVAKYMEDLDKDEDAPDLVAGASKAETDDIKTKWEVLRKKYAKQRLGNLSWCNLSDENAPLRQGGAGMEEDYAGVSRSELRVRADDGVFHRQ